MDQNEYDWEHEVMRDHNDYYWDYDGWEDDYIHYYEEDSIMTRREKAAYQLKRFLRRVQVLALRIKWHNPCNECGIDTNNGTDLCEKHEIPF
jgi:hypothetical protein